MTTSDLATLNKIESFFLRGYYDIYNMMKNELSEALHQRLKADGYNVKIFDKNVAVQITKPVLPEFPEDRQTKKMDTV